MREIPAALLLLTWPAAGFAAGGGRGAPPGASPPQEIILDLSSAMNASFGARTRLERAREVLKRALEQPAGRVSVRVYGRRRARDCEDTELLLPPAASRTPEELSRLSKIEALGQAPVELALRAALKDLGGRRGALLLIAGGPDTCGGDPCRLAPRLKAAGVRADVVGFETGLQGSAGLRCVAELTGGRYYTASDDERFEGAVSQSRLEAYCPDCGKIEARYQTPAADLPKTGYRLLNAGTREALGLYPLTNTVSAAPPGLYDLVLVPETGREVYVRGVRVEPGATVKAVFDASGRGELLALFTSRAGRDLASGYKAASRATGEVWPVILLANRRASLPEGTWDLSLEDAGETLVLKDVLVEAGGRSTVRFKHEGGGRILASYEPLAGAGSAEIRYEAQDEAEKEVVLKGLAVNRPAEVPAGVYDLFLSPQAGIELKAAGVKVKPGRTRKVKFSNVGLGVVTAAYREGEALRPAFLYSALKEGRAFPGPLLTNQPMLLPAGTYDLVLKRPSGTFRASGVIVEDGKMARAEFKP